MVLISALLTPQMASASPNLLGLPREARQNIYDYVFDDAGDKTITITLNEASHLRTHNGPTILNLMLANKRFAEEVPAYLFAHTTFLLSDSERTCYPIFTALSRRMRTFTASRITKLAIHYLSIRALFDPIHLGKSSNLEFQLYHEASMPYKPYVHARMRPDDYRNHWSGVDHIQPVLCREHEFAMDLVGRLPTLTYLELGVDVLEFLIYEDKGSVDQACAAVRKRSEKMQYRASLSGSSRPKLLGTHMMLQILNRLRAASNFANLHVRLRWSGFVERAYRDGGIVFADLTEDVKEEMRVLYMEHARVAIQEYKDVGRVDMIVD